MFCEFTQQTTLPITCLGVWSKKKEGYGWNALYESVEAPLVQKSSFEFPAVSTGVLVNAKEQIQFFINQ